MTLDSKDLTLLQRLLLPVYPALTMVLTMRCAASAEVGGADIGDYIPSGIWATIFASFTVLFAVAFILNKRFVYTVLVGMTGGSMAVWTYALLRVAITDGTFTRGYWIWPAVMTYVSLVLAYSMESKRNPWGLESRYDRPEG